MGLLKFTKQYTASDDGSKLGGADLGQIESDISSVLNGGITNVNVSASAGIVESKLTFDTTSGHNHDGSNSRVISSGGYRGFIQGAELEWVSVATVKAQSGIIEISGNLYTRTSYSTTLNMATDANWVEGTSQEGASQIAYVYAYNDSGTTWDIKFWLQAPQYANTGTDDSSTKIYRSNAGVWYRCIGFVRNDAGSDLTAFFQKNEKVMLDIPVTLTTTLSAGAWTDGSTMAKGDCSSIVSTLTTCVIFGLTFGEANDGTLPSLFIRPNGSTWTTNAANGLYNQQDGTTNRVFSQQRICMTDSAQKINYYNAAATDSISITIEGFFLDIR